MEESRNRRQEGPRPLQSDEPFRPASPASGSSSSRSVFNHANPEPCFIRPHGMFGALLSRRHVRAGCAQFSRLREPMPQAGRSFSKGWRQPDVHVQMQTSQLRLLQVQSPALEMRPNGRLVGRSKGPRRLRPRVWTRYVSGTGMADHCVAHAREESSTQRIAYRAGSRHM